MKRPLLILLLVLGIVILVGGIIFSSVVGIYNHLITLDQEVESSWSQVENQYQRRADLIPNLVETVKGYAKQEETIFTEIADARARIGSAQTRVQREAEENQLTGFLSRLLMIQENYPQLKSNENFRDLQAQLEGTENRISVERQRYIQAIKTYNVEVRKFPGRIIAGMLGFEPKDFYQADEEAKQVPQVNFGTGSQPASATP